MFRLDDTMRHPLFLKGRIDSSVPLYEPNSHERLLAKINSRRRVFRTDNMQVGYSEAQNDKFLSMLHFEKEDLDYLTGRVTLNTYQQKGGFGCVFDATLRMPGDIVETRSVKVKFPIRLIQNGAFTIKSANENTVHFSLPANIKPIIEHCKEEFIHELDMYNLLVANEKYCHDYEGKPRPSSTICLFKERIDKFHADLLRENRIHGVEHLMQVVDFDMNIPCSVSYSYDGTVWSLFYRWNACDETNRGLLQLYLSNNQSNLISHVAQGLLYMHSQGIAHNDIKHNNIFFAGNPARGLRFVIGDFGGCVEHAFEWTSIHCTSWGKTLPRITPDGNTTFPVLQDVYAFCTLVQEYMHLQHAPTAPMKPNAVLKMCFPISRRKRVLVDFFGTDKFGGQIASCSEPLYSQLESLREGVLCKDQFRFRDRSLPERTYMLRDEMYSEFVSVLQQWISSQNGAVPDFLPIYMGYIKKRIAEAPLSAEYYEALEISKDIVLANVLEKDLPCAADSSSSSSAAASNSHDDELSAHAKSLTPSSSAAAAAASNAHDDELSAAAASNTHDEYNAYLESLMHPHQAQMGWGSHAARDIKQMLFGNVNSVWPSS